MLLATISAWGHMSGDAGRTPDEMWRNDMLLTSTLKFHPSFSWRVSHMGLLSILQKNKCMSYCLAHAA